MSVLTYHITEAATVKTYLRRHLGLSARAVIRLKEGGIQINGNHARTVDVLCPGDILTLLPEDTPATAYIAEKIPMHILYEDDGFLVVDKPACMPVYPAGKHSCGSLLNSFAFSHPGLIFRPLYRLDRNTSGVLVVAKTKPAAGAVLTKEYFAVCQGLIPPDGVVDVPIGLEDGSKIKRSVGTGQRAHTEFTRLSQAAEHSLAQVKITTGRTHQIRVHMASIGFPLAGDNLYGGSTKIITRQALHCSSVHICSVPYNLGITVNAEVPHDFFAAFPALFTVASTE